MRHSNGEYRGSNPEDGKAIENGCDNIQYKYLFWMPGGLQGISNLLVKFCTHTPGPKENLFTESGYCRRIFFFRQNLPIFSGIACILVNIFLSLCGLNSDGMLCLYLIEKQWI